MSLLEYLQNDRFRLIVVLIILGIFINTYFVYSKFVALRRSQLAATREVS